MARAIITAPITGDITGAGRKIICSQKVRKISGPFFIKKALRILLAPVQKLAALLDYTVTVIHTKKNKEANNEKRDHRIIGSAHCGHQHTGICRRKAWLQRWRLWLRLSVLLVVKYIINL